MKSDEINRHQTISNDSNRHQLKTDEIEMPSPPVTRESSETPGAKDEIIALLKEGIERAQNEAERWREAHKDLSKQNEQLTKLTTDQNQQLTALTHLLVVPKNTQNRNASQQWRTSTPDNPEETDNIRDAEFSEVRKASNDPSNFDSSNNDQA
jgi:hypothetical protein